VCGYSSILLQVLYIHISIYIYIYIYIHVREHISDSEQFVIYSGTA